MSHEPYRTFKQASFDSASTAEKAEFDMRCIPLSDGALALIMPVEGWAAFLGTMRDVRGQNAALDTMYEGIKFGFGFTLPSEALRPEQPDIEA